MSAWDLLLWAVGRRRRIRIVGASMAPTFRPGDEVLVDPRAYRTRPPVRGDVVLARHPYRGDVRLVKRVTRVEPSGAVFLEGDNPAESSDSRVFGALRPERLLGRVVGSFGS